MDRLWRVPALAAAVAAVVALAGCSSEGKVGVVTGQVTVDGKPAEGIALTFQGADGRVTTALSDASGGYRAENVPVGPVTVGAYSPGGETEQEAMIQKNRGNLPPDQRARESTAPAPKKKAPKVAARYAEPATSGLTHTATEGESKFDVPLTSK